MFFVCISHELTRSGCFHRKPRFLSPPTLLTLSVELRPGRFATERESGLKENTPQHWDLFDRRRQAQRVEGEEDGESFWSHLFGEHRDVVEISLTSLFHGQDEEKPAPVLGEQRLLSLQRQTVTSEVTYFTPQRQNIHRCADNTAGDSFTVSGRNLIVVNNQVHLFGEPCR